MTAAFIGIDWGTTHRRASVLDAQGRLLAQHSDGEGMLACAGRFRESLLTLLQRWPEISPDVPVVMSGMVGAVFFAERDLLRLAAGASIAVVFISRVLTEAGCLDPQCNGTY